MIYQDQVFFNTYLFLAVRGLRCCKQAFSSCRAQASHHGGFSYFKAWAPRVWASIVVADGLVCPTAVISSWTRDPTTVPCITKWILNHWTTRKPQGHLLLLRLLSVLFEHLKEFSLKWGFPIGTNGKEPTEGDVRDVCSVPGWEISPGEGQWQPTPVFMPGESHGQRSPTGYSGSIGSQRVRHDSCNLVPTQS